MIKALPALLVEYRDLALGALHWYRGECPEAEYPEAFDNECPGCVRMREIEVELTEALECARLVNGIREAVQAAEEQRNGE